MESPIPEAVTHHRFIGAGGYSATIAGVMKIVLGIVIKAAGWAVSELIQQELVQAMTMLIGLGLDLWGASQVYTARMSRGDINVLGKRMAPVEVIVKPPAPPTPPEA